MNRKRTGWVIAATWAVLSALSGCRTDDGNPADMGRAAGGPSEGIRGVSLSSYRVGDTRWVLHADTASVFRDRKRVIAETVHVDFFEDDVRVSVLTADRGVLQQSTDDLEARGNVRVETEDGGLLETEVLFWDHQQARIHTEERVKITRGNNVLIGVGLETDPRLERIDIKEDVAGSVAEVPADLGKDEGESHNEVDQ